MMERISNTSWKILLNNSLLMTLSMNNSGFGITDTQIDLLQSIGHLSQGSGWQVKNEDNPAILGPASTVHIFKR